MSIRKESTFDTLLHIMGGGTLQSSPSELKTYLRLVITDPTGKTMDDSGEFESHNFVIQFLETIYRFFVGSSANFTDTSGAENYGYFGTSGNPQAYLCAPINESLYGIVVGTGDTAENNTDFKLATQLTEGVTVGKITHNTCSINAAAAVVGANVDMVLVRSFTNNTGALITVKEAGIYIRNMTTAPLYYHCSVRDVLPVAKDVPDKCSLTVFYTYRTTV